MPEMAAASTRWRRACASGVAAWLPSTASGSALDAEKALMHRREARALEMSCFFWGV